MNISVNTPLACTNKCERKGHRKQILELLAVTGYATVRQVARRIWGRCDDSTRKLAGRKLRQLLEEGLIVSKRDGGANKVSNEKFFALNRAGAKCVREEGSPLVAGKVHARDYLRHAHAHRTACNSVYCAWPADVTIWTELQVRSGECPISAFNYSLAGGPFCTGEAMESKIPDLIADAGNGRFEWIEVENAWRSEKDLEKMVKCLQTMFLRDHRFECVHFIVTTPAAKTIGKRLKKALTYALDSGEYRHIKEVSAHILAKHLRVWALEPFTLTLTQLRVE